MSTHKHIDRICCAALAAVLVLTLLFVNGEALGLEAASSVMGYEARLFDASRVHTIDIVMDDWDGFIETCENEEYTACAVVIDGESKRNVGIRAKGNTSLSSVAAYGNDRYSFKIEFDHYDSTASYYGLDKLNLNNVIQDNTYMKDFLVYQLMGKFGAAAPLCSYAWITVNGEDWGLYLAVEGVEDAFLQRNYGRDYGALYKPDSLSFGGGPGNGREFSFGDFEELESPTPVERPEVGTPPENFTPSRGNIPGGDNQRPEVFGGLGENSGPGEFGGREERGGPGGGFAGGMGSADVKLQYIDDDPDSYANIFDNAKTDITEADKTRLVASLKALSSGENIENIVDVEQVVRYFVVHGFVCNGDSYTGNMIHNYYLYEKDGRMAMLPWDYNLAFGAFQSSGAESAVNEPIDSPVSGSMDDRPMIAWIFGSEAYTELYHQYYQEFIAGCFDSGWCEELISGTEQLIAPYVEKDPSKFCTYEEFEKGVSALQQFCALRAESVRGQLAGTIPSTAQGQAENSDLLVDASGLNISDMGTMNQGGGFRGGDRNISPEEMPQRDGGGAVEAFRPQQMGGRRDPDGQAPEQRDSGAVWPVLAGAAVLLLAGLAFACGFRRRKTPPG